MKDDAASLVELSPTEKRMLLAQRLKAKASAPKPFPMSFAQQRLWFLDQMQPGSTLYNIPGVVRLRGKLHLAALRKALNEIVRRHEVLRTTFDMLNEQPVQIVAPPVGTELPVVDLCELPEDERQAETRRLYEAEGKIHFNLAQGPLLRAKLLLLPDEQQLLIFTLHHIISDGWSTAVLIKELTILYESFAKNVPSPLPELPIQYVDFAVWQHKRLSGEFLEKQLAYWKEQLAGIPAALELPTDHPRMELRGASGAELSLLLSKPLGERLVSLSREEGVTLFMLMLAAFQTLLHRYTGQTTVVVGTPIAGRDRAELEPLIGLFVNTLVLRADYGDQPTFRQLLARVKETALAAYAHQSVPFEKVVAELQPERRLDHVPIFQVMFTLQSVPYGEEELSELSSFGDEVKNIAAGTGLPLSKFDLTLSVLETKAGIYCSIQYREDLFDESTIRRMLENFRVLLQSIVDTPDARVSALPMLAEAERRLLLVEWNQTNRERQRGLGLTQMFEAQAARAPAATALVYRHRQLSYHELNERANRLAALLRTRGVQAEVIVGLLARHSPEMIVGLLAILKAGGAYLPLDRTSPQGRLAFMLADAQASLVLAQDDLVASLPEDAPPVVALSEQSHFGDHVGESERSEEKSATHPAYVAYTSGSQGKPLGIVIEERQVIESVRTLIEHLSVAPGTSWGLLPPLTVNASQTLIFASLCAGATLHLIDEEHAADLPALGRHLAQHPVDGLRLAPSQLFPLLSDVASETPLRLNRLILGGEPLRWELIEELRRTLPDTFVLNHYSPVEVTGGGIAHPVHHYEASNHIGGSAPLGRPLPNTRAYVLDPLLQPVPIGAGGELYIGGDCLARGYIKGFRDTAESFIPNPFDRQPGARIYKTGDLARRLPDGNLLFLGRARDRQIKIGGVRIEPEEIEAILRAHASVLAAFVMAQEDTRRIEHLVAYLVAPEDADEERVRVEVWEMLRKSLPVEMLPSALIFLDDLPLSPGGQIDVQLLPSPYKAISAPPREFVAPRDTTELRLARIWEELLGVSQISVKDNFFDLGGHSLLAVRMMAQARKQLGRQIPLAALFERATVEHLADMLRRETPDETESPLVAIQPRGDRRPFFCVHEIGGGVIDYIHLARHLGTEQPFYGLQAITAHGSNTESVEDMASRYLEAVREVQAVGPYILGGWSFGGLIAFEMAQQLQKMKQDVALLALFDSMAPGFLDRSAFADLPDTHDPAMLVRFIKETLGADFNLPLDDYQSFTPSAQLSYIFAQAKSACLIPQEIELAEFLVWLQAVGNRMKAEREYAARPYAGRVTLFNARDLSLHPAHIRERLALDPTYGWGKLSFKGIETYFVPGTHRTIMQEPNVSALAEQLKRLIIQIEVGAES